MIATIDNWYSHLFFMNYLQWKYKYQLSMVATIDNCIHIILYELFTINKNCQWLQPLTTDIHIYSLWIIYNENINTNCQWLQLLTIGIYIYSLWIISQRKYKYQLSMVATIDNWYSYYSLWIILQSIKIVNSCISWQLIFTFILYELFYNENMNTICQ